MRIAALPPDAVIHLLSSCGRSGNLRLGASLHAAVVKNAQLLSPAGAAALFLCNSLISMYSRCRRLPDAIAVFNHMAVKDTVSWNSVISACIRGNQLNLGLRFFRQLLRSQTSHCDHATMTTLLSSFASPELLHACRAVHCAAQVNGLAALTPVGNALITAYFNCGSASSAHKVFGGTCERNVITWTAMISGLVHGESFLESLRLFKEMTMMKGAAAEPPNAMTLSISLSACSGLQALPEASQIHGLAIKAGHEADICVQSSLMDVYSKCGLLDAACRVFDTAELLDQVSFTVILVGFAQNGMEGRALAMFVKLQRSGQVQLDPNIISAVLGAFGDSGQLSLGKQLHCLALKSCFCDNVFVGNGLVNMYSKSGELDNALHMFDEMRHRNLVSWNAVIGALARHGRGEDALRAYDVMRASDVVPNDVTFLSLLHACGHVGNVSRGAELLRTMEEAYRIRPRVEHWACMVDMMGRAGLVEEARDLVNGLEEEPRAVVWQALLGACGIRGDSATGAYAARRLLKATPKCPAAYVQMANMYSSEERWEERAKVVKRMREVGVRKEPALSWIEVGKKVNVFVVGDRAHPQHERIYSMLEILTGAICEEI